MSLFTKQPMFCCICGTEIMFDFNYRGIPICDVQCWDEYQRRKSLYILGKKYYVKSQQTTFGLMKGELL